MKRLLLSAMLFSAFGFFAGVQAQDSEKVNPTSVSRAIYHDVSPPLRDLPPMTKEEFQEQMIQASKKRNEELKERSYPNADMALPKGPDPVWQQSGGQTRGQRAPALNFSGQSSYSNPPDCNGAVGPNHYMQTINVSYTIYNKSGSLVAGPTAMNTLFSGVPGSGVNDGDPIIMYDDQADRWLAAEFSGVYSNPDYMLIAVSTTNDPTGTWDRWSFLMNGFPDYMKFGIWHDGYYMGTNTGSGDDIYVFERDVMLAGGATPQAVQFDNPNRPNSGFHCILPLDNDGSFAAPGTPGMFITINDDAWQAGTSDELWIYECDVDWATPSNSTFGRVQQLSVASFDSNFGPNWDNIAQPGVSQKLDGIPQVLMQRAQYLNFGTYQTIVCNHAVDVDNTDHAGIRWYELRNTGATWTVRQQGTYAPDGHSRWMGAIAMNQKREIGLAYSISSTTEYPGIRYCGQTVSGNNGAIGVLDIAEDIIITGSASQLNYNRWGDYANLSVDPVDDTTFWFTTEYNITGTQKGTQVAAFRFGPEVLTAEFMAGDLSPSVNVPVTFTDLSIGGPVSWSWDFSPATVSYAGGTSTSSQNPQVEFTATGLYTVTLTISDGSNNDTEIKTDYINVVDCVVISLPWTEDFEHGGSLPDCWTQEYGVNSEDWICQDGGVNSHPASANGGSYNAIFFFNGVTTNVTKLVSPPLDLTGVTNVTLNFWHTQDRWINDQDELRVYYRTSAGGAWTLLQAWTGRIASWTEETLVLPNPGSTYYIAFEGTSHYGYGVCIDDVTVDGDVPGLWNGNTSSDWSTASNWDGGQVPADNTDVVIPGGRPNYPLLNGNLYINSASGTYKCKSLVIRNGAQINLGPGNEFRIYGDVTVEDGGIINIGNTAK